MLDLQERLKNSVRPPLSTKKNLKECKKKARRPTILIIYISNDSTCPELITAIADPKILNLLEKEIIRREGKTPIEPKSTETVFNEVF